MTQSPMLALVGGTVTLRSDLIDPALLDTDFDVFAIRKAIQAANASPGWDRYVIDPFGDLATARSDTELEAYAWRNAAPVFRPVGTTVIGLEDSSSGVVDPHFVKGAVDFHVFVCIISSSCVSLLFLQRIRRLRSMLLLSARRVYFLNLSREIYFHEKGTLRIPSRVYGD